MCSILRGVDTGTTAVFVLSRAAALSIGALFASGAGFATAAAVLEVAACIDTGFVAHCGSRFGASGDASTLDAFFSFGAGVSTGSTMVRVGVDINALVRALEQSRQALELA